MSVRRVYHHRVNDGPITFGISVNCYTHIDEDDPDDRTVTEPELVIYLDDDEHLEHVRVVDTGGDSYELRLDR